MTRRNAMNWKKGSGHVLAVLIVASIPTAMADASTVAYWRFENNLLDSSGNGLDATGGTGFGYSTNIPGVAIDPGGLPNTASYDQGTAATTVGANATMSGAFAANSFTVEAFVYLNAGGNNFQQLIENTVEPSQGIYFSVGTSISGYVYGKNGAGATSDKVAGSGLSTDTWHHVAWVGTYQPGSGTAVQFFVDGSAVGTAAFYAETGGVAINMSATDWKIGGPSNNFNGVFDELRISDEALTPDQFLQAVPEPASMTLLGLGLALIVRRRW